MKKTRWIPIMMLFALLIVSCKPIYKCGQAKPEKKLSVSKRFQAVIDERDSLCETLSIRENEIIHLKNEIQSLNTDINNLNNSLRNSEKQYQELMGRNISQAEMFNETLRQKSDDLNKKERLLQERERALKEMQDIIARQDSITRRLNDILRNALLGFQSDELSVEIRNGKVYVSMSDKLLFKSGSASVEAKGKRAITVLAEVLQKNPDVDILVEGHTDNIPIRTNLYRDNWDLSVARATSIVRILTEEFKIAPVRLTASGRGEFMPRATNATPEGRASNRRTEIILSPKLDEIMEILKN